MIDVSDPILIKRIKELKMVFFDFDGVFTDNRVIICETGEESVICNRSDGIGLSRLRSLGVDMMIISTEPNSVVQERAKKLKIECHNGCDDKLEKMKLILADRKISIINAAFVGNDINDLACLNEVGLSVIVRDAYPELDDAAMLKLSKKGGEGCVREFCDLVYWFKTH